MVGINLKRKVNFKRKMKDGVAVVEIIEAKDKPAKLVPDNRLDCQYCRRLFQPDSHSIHQKVCNNVFMKRRDLFESVMQRMMIPSTSKDV